MKIRNHHILLINFVVIVFFTFSDSLADGPYTPQTEFKVDRTGKDYRDFDLPQSGYQQCRSACDQDNRCRAWTYVKPGIQGPKPRCWLKNEVSKPVVNDCCISGFYNVLTKIQACRSIGNTKGSKPATCIDPGGKSFGKAGRTFMKGDKVMILSRFKRLHTGGKELIAVYQRYKNGKFRNFSNNKKVVKFKNDSKNWALWFPAHFLDTGKWRVKIALSGKSLTGQILGDIEYCVNCQLE